jgi:transposase-like protein
MTRNFDPNQPAIRYSEAFKLEVVRELETRHAPMEQVRRKYGVGYGSIQAWIAKYGNGTRGRIIRVEIPKEINELKRLKDRIKRLESVLADTNLDLALERQYTRLACERAGIRDVAEFKKSGWTAARGAVAQDAHLIGLNLARLAACPADAAGVHPLAQTVINALSIGILLSW